MRLRYLPIDDVHPFDRTHWRTDEAPGFATKDKVPGEHLEGALHVKRLVESGALIAPIAVCPMSLVPSDRPRSAAPFQRLDGFKRYMGQRMAGETKILCAVHDQYLPGCQRGAPLTLTLKELLALIDEGGHG